MSLPERGLPVVYFSFARISLALALLTIAVEPRTVAGFFYHARMLAVVHLLTLGWISSSIMGSLYIVGPIALRMPMPVNARDRWACGLALVGIAGMASHFYIGAFGGMAWSALMVSAGFAMVAVKVLRRLQPAPIQGAVKLAISLSFGNLLLAATAGVLLGFDKTRHFLPGYVLANVFAHAHLAAVGWATMMVVGVGERLLPMILPSAMPRGWRLLAAPILLELGVALLFGALVLRSAWVGPAAITIVAGLGVFLSQVVWMIRHPRPAPPALRRPDYAALHAMTAFSSLALAAFVGIVLAFAPVSERTLRLALVYGVFGLLGFLGQLIAGIEARLLPLLAWYWAFKNTDFKGPVPSPHEMSIRFCQQAAWWLWVCGVPCVAGGFYFEAIPFLTAGAWMLLAAVVLGAVDAVAIMRYAYRGPGLSRFTRAAV